MAPDATAMANAHTMRAHGIRPGAGPPSTPCRLLLASAAPDPLRVLLLRLGEGCALDCVPDIAGALASIEAQWPELLVIDADTLDQAGAPLIERIRGNPAWAGMRILVVSSRGLSPLAEHRADDWFSPEAGASEFEARLRAHLRAARQNHDRTLRMLSESRSRLQLALNAAKMGTFVWHVQEDRGEPDAQMLALTGQAADGPHSLRHALATLIHPDDRDAYAAAVERAIDPRHGGVLHHDTRIVAADGSLRWLTITGQVAFSDDGTPLTMTGAAVDVTDRKEADEALRASEERFRQFGEASSNVLWIRDARTLRWEYLTPAFTRIYGMDVEEALHHPEVDLWLRFIVPHDRERVLSHLLLARDGQRVTFEYRIVRRADGEQRWLRNTAFPMSDASGRVSRIGGIVHDITRERAAEERIAQNEERLRSALAVGRLGTWDWNVLTGEVSWSDEHFRIAGYAVGEVVPSYRAWLDHVHPDDRAGVAAAVQEAMSEHKEFVHEFRFSHPDGSVHWAAARGRFYYDESGSALRMLGTLLETTERREWEDRQKVLVSELQHRTRNIMAVVGSIAERSLATSTHLGEFAGRFRERLGALARVQGLLSRLEDVERVSFDELLRSELAAHGVLDARADRVELDGPAGVALRSGTVQVIAMALHELTTNAVKYGALLRPPGRLTVRWRVVRDRPAPYLAVLWKESQVAMPPASNGQGGGAGRELIERALPYQIGARVVYDMQADGVRCEIELPLSRHLDSP